MDVATDAIQVWAPIAVAVSKGLWQDVSFAQVYIASPLVSARLLNDVQQAQVKLEKDANKQGCHEGHTLPSLPELFEKIRCNPDQERMEAFDITNPETIHLLCDDMRRWHSWLTDQSSDRLSTAEVSWEFQSWLGGLTGYLNELQADNLHTLASSDLWPQDGLTKAGKTRGYSLAFLLQVVFLAADLRSVRSIKDVIQNAIQIVLPRHAKHLQQMLERPRALPSKSTILHMQLVLDVALMLLQRLEIKRLLGLDGGASNGPDWGREIQDPFLQARLAMYWLVDSSPQGGRNWLMMEYWSIKAENVLPAFFKARELQHMHVSRRHQPFADDDGEEMERFLECQNVLVEDLCQLVFHHHVPPVGLGYGQASAHHEASALAHAVYLESGSSAVMQDVGRAVVTFTTDKGWPSSLSQTQTTSLTCFPK